MNTSWNTQALKFLLRVLRCFQLWGEMRSSNPHQFAIRLEMIRVSLCMLIIRSSPERLPDIAFESMEESPLDEYVGSRSGTKLRSISRSLDIENQTSSQLSDFLHAIVPLVYLSGSRGWRKAKWASWLLAITLETASIMSLPDNLKHEKGIRMKRMIAEATVRQPMFDLVLRAPAQTISNIWGRIPLLRDINYLEYYIGMHVKYFYFHQ
jgi:hypothetical protein